MSETPSILTPLIAQLGVGGIGGLCVGYAVKKVAKVVNYGALEAWGVNALGSAVAAEGVLAAMIANLPFAASFVVGLGMGLKMG
jgi:uncharacterized membrane protein (Fun14 family)